MRILFICKRHHHYGNIHYQCKKDSGLYNSTHFIVNGLKDKGIHADIVTVNDNNDIDREVTKFKPDKVVIEALWVVPNKFDVLQTLHPSVGWYVHLHSDLPFLATEGIAIEWLFGYAQRGVGIITNCDDTFKSLSYILGSEPLYNLHNVYLRHFLDVNFKDKSCIHVACMGAIRPLKNQLIQAMAAVEFAKELGKDLAFHINTARIEQGGEPILKNIRKLFSKTPNAGLVEHGWIDSRELVHWLHNVIDIGMQVSLTETFNVVSADYVAAGVPIVVSNQVKWASKYSQAQTDSVENIVKTMHWAHRNWALCKWNAWCLQEFSEKSLCEWVEFCNG